jgi:hypothetical protein
MSGVVHHWRGVIRRRFPVPEPGDQEARTTIVIAVRKAIVVLYLWMFTLTVACLFAFLVYAHHNETSNRQSQAECVRSRDFAPELAKAYSRFKILDPHALALYVSSIPKHCS